MIKYLYEFVPTLLIGIVGCFLLWGGLHKTPERKLVFECSISTDGLCLAIDRGDQVLECYTGTGIDLGYCEIDQYLIEEGGVCDPKLDWCPMVYEPNRLIELGQERRGLVVFKTIDRDGSVKDAFCHDTKLGTKCSLVTGRSLPETDWKLLADKDFSVCYPKYESCLLSPAMMGKAY